MVGKITVNRDESCSVNVELNVDILYDNMCVCVFVCYFFSSKIELSNLALWNAFGVRFSGWTMFQIKFHTYNQCGGGSPLYNSFHYKMACKRICVFHCEFRHSEMNSEQLR